MTVYVYDCGNHAVEAPLQDFEVSALLSKNSARAQKLLTGLAQTKRWLSCDCHTPHALMYPRNHKGTFTLVNHYCLGKHDPRCPFFSKVKGADRAEAERDTVDDAINGLLGREDSFALFRLFPSEVPPEPTTDDEKPKSKSQSGPPRIDTLLRIYYNCVDSAYLNYFHGKPLDSSVGSIESQLLLVRDRTSAMFVRGGQPHLMTGEQLEAMSNPLKEICFTGTQGLTMAQSFLLREMRQRKGRARPTAIVMLTGDQYVYNARKSTITLVTETNEGPQVTHLTDIVKPPIYGADMSHTSEFPVVVIAAYTFESPESTLPVIGKVAVTPILGNGSICPVDNVYEQQFLIAANFVVTTFRNSYPDYAFYISKPLFGFRKHPDIMPGLILSVKNISTGKLHRSYIEILPDKTKKRLDALDSKVAKMKIFYSGETTYFHAYEYPLEKSKEMVRAAVMLLRNQLSANIKQVS